MVWGEQGAGGYGCQLVACWHFRNRGDCAFLRFFLVIFFHTATAHFCNLYKYFIHYLFYTHIIYCFFLSALAIEFSPALSPTLILSLSSLSIYFFVASFCALYKYCINFVFIILFGYSHLCIFDGIVFGFRSTNFSVKFYAESLEFMSDTWNTKDLRSAVSSLGYQCVLLWIYIYHICYIITLLTHDILKKNTFNLMQYPNF